MAERTVIESGVIRVDAPGSSASRASRRLNSKLYCRRTLPRALSNEDKPPKLLRTGHPARCKRLKGRPDANHLHPMPRNGGIPQGKTTRDSLPWL